jgi:COP9 signalosome complex subunit 4
MAVSSPTFIPSALASSSTSGIVSIITTTLAHLPPAGVEGGADNTLRQLLFDYYCELGEYGTAAKYLAGLRMLSSDDGTNNNDNNNNNATSSPYYMTPVQRVDVFVKVAECYLEEDLTVEAEGAVTKAGTIIESTGIGSGIMSTEKNSNGNGNGNDDVELTTSATAKDETIITLMLRYKSTYARVLDINRKFLQAAVKYHDLSLSYLYTDAIDPDDLLIMLGKAITMAILSPNSAQRQRVLGLVYKDPRLYMLDAITEYQSHSSVVTKMYLNRIVQKRELELFESSLAEHQRAIMADGLTIVERGVLEHNMVAVSQLYTSIYFNQLCILLGGIVDANKAEKVAAKMITDGSLHGTIDEVEGILYFNATSSTSTSKETKDTSSSALLHWDETITAFCTQLNKVTDVVRSKN